MELDVSNGQSRGRGRPPALLGQEQAVVELYLSGATIPEVCAAFGVSDGPVVRVLDAAGVQRRRGRPPGRTTGSTTPRRPPNPGKPITRGKPKPTPPAEVVADAAVKLEVMRRDGHRCRQCGSRDRLLVEYTITPDRGGSKLKASDLRTVCASCATAPVAKKTLLRRLLRR